MSAPRLLDFLGRGVPQVARTQLLKNKAWVGGRWMKAITRKTYPVCNPASRELVAEVPDMGAEDVQIAVQDAYSSQRAWAALPCKERASLIRRWFDLMMEHKNDLAKIISLEMGKPYSESLVEVTYGASFLEWFAEEAKRIDGDIIPPPVKGRRVLITKQPVGVCALITPWNFPVAMVTRKAGAALAAGCTAVVKPSEEAPFSALALAELSQQAGIPSGVFNVITSSRQSAEEVGGALTSSDLVAKLSFTGSTAVGKVLMSQCASTIKRVSLELGGNAPFIVFNSADIPQAIQGLLASKYRNTGQTCICPNRILVQSGVHDAFVEKLAASVAQLRQGEAFTEGVQQGPLINEQGVRKVEQHVSDALSKGAEVLVGGRRAEEIGPNFFKPSVLTGVNTDMRIAHEETFGPVAAMVKFEEEEEAVAIANSSPFGLAGYFYSQDISQVWRVSEALQTGIVGVNETAISSEVGPFGGIKQSGIGREGSKYGIENYLNLKYICWGSIVEEL